MKRAITLILIAACLFTVAAVVHPHSIFEDVNQKLMWSRIFMIWGMTILVGGLIGTIIWFETRNK